MKKIICLSVVIVLFIPLLAFAGPSHYITRNFPAAVNEKAFDKVCDYLMEKDWEALARLKTQGKWVELKKGERVYLEKVHTMSGAAEVRKPGQTRHLWVILEYVKD